MSGTELIRPAGLFDIPLIRKLQRRGVQLDPKQALTRSDTPLAALLRGPLSVLDPPAYTYVARFGNSNGREAGFVQLRCRLTNCNEAEVSYISPALLSDAVRGEIWTRLLEAASWEVACVGIQRIYANLPADTEDAVPFLNAGFMIFAREELLARVESNGAAPLSHVTVRRQQTTDIWTLQRLYARIIPLGVKQAEGLCELDSAQQNAYRWGQQPGREFHVLETHGDIVGHVEVVRGKQADWVHFALDPDMLELADELVAAGLSLVEDSGRIVYTHVRTYESMLKPALLQQGFEVLDRRDVALRQTFARVKLAAPVAVRGLERCPEISSGATLSRVK